MLLLTSLSEPKHMEKIQFVLKRACLSHSDKSKQVILWLQLLCRHPKINCCCASSHHSLFSPSKCCLHASFPPFLSFRELQSLRRLSTLNVSAASEESQPLWFCSAFQGLIKRPQTESKVSQRRSKTRAGQPQPGARSLNSCFKPQPAFIWKWLN